MPARIITLSDHLDRAHWLKHNSALCVTTGHIQLCEINAVLRRGYWTVTLFITVLAILRHFWWRNFVGEECTNALTLQNRKVDNEMHRSEWTVSIEEGFQKVDHSCCCTLSARAFLEQIPSPLFSQSSVFLLSIDQL